MTSNAKRLFIALALLTVLVLSLVFVVPLKSGAQEQVVGSTYSKVTLYSNDGKVIGTWTAVGLGRMDGNTFVFSVYRGVGATSERIVRIHGTFAVEQTAP